MRACRRRTRVRRRRRPGDRGRRTRRARRRRPDPRDRRASTSTTAGCCAATRSSPRYVEPRAAARARRRTASSVIETPVGDRHVLDALEQRNLVLGGEQSGHVIFADHATTGDGTLTGILLLDIDGAPGPAAVGAGRRCVTRVPQVLAQRRGRRRRRPRGRRRLLEPGARRRRRARRRRPGARAPVGHRAAGAGDGRGADADAAAEAADRLLVEHVQHVRGSPTVVAASGPARGLALTGLRWSLVSVGPASQSFHPCVASSALSSALDAPVPDAAALVGTSTAP